MIEKAPFRKYSLKDNPQDIISLKLNEEERKKLEIIKRYMQQPKDSTTFKQCLELVFAKVIRGNFSKEILNIVTNNIRKNQRIGIIDYEDVVYN